MDLAINAFIFIVTFVLTLGFFYKDRQWTLTNGRKAFRYFTVQSNVLCAFAALLMCFEAFQPFAWWLKYPGTAAVTVTMLTVFLFLGPNMGYGELLKGPDLFMHLITPLLAIASFCLLEKRGLSFPGSLPGMIPVTCYGFLYLYKVIYAPEGRRWDDFYGFNKGGKWPVSLLCMLLGSFGLCMLFMLLQNR